MSQEQWTAVDEYFQGVLAPNDAHLEAALANADAAGLPAIQVTAGQGKLLHLLARLQGARRILEIGTLGGYSTIWLARALRDGGTLISLEADPKHAQVARANIARAGLSGVAEVIEGKALDTLPLLAEEDNDPFDLIFIDADKSNIPGYFKWALEFSKPGSLIIVDNVVRGGKVVEANSESADVQGVREFLEMAAAEPRVEATAVQTVGAKGYDGFALALVVA